MFQKSLLILAIAAACCSTAAQAQSTPAKKELVARILKVQQPGIEQLARQLVQDPIPPLMDRASAALQQRVPPDKRDAVAKEIESDVQKYLNDAIPVVQDRALKLAPTTVGALLEEKFTEDELKQVAAMMESPVFAKFQSLGGDMQRALAEKLVAETRPQVGPKLQALTDTIAKRLGMEPGASNGQAPKASGKAPGKK
jgi:uncharacterized protein